jgi:hypothetical protein
MVYRDEPSSAARGFRMSDARRPRFCALASAGEFAATAAFRGFELAADSAALCKSEVVVVQKIEPKLRRCRPKYFPKRTAVSCADGPASTDDLVDARNTQPHKRSLPGAS